LDEAVRFDECVIAGHRFAPARFCAPLAGYTHSAFRRLVAEFGGCGAFWTEMLAAKKILQEDFGSSPWLKRRPVEGLVVYQLMIRAGDPIAQIMERLGCNGVKALDLNLACDALSVRVHEAGSALFDNPPALRSVLKQVRRHWPHLLTVKIRLGGRHPDWQSRLVERLRMFEDEGVDAIILHPRFFEDKFRRRARHELLPWVAQQTKLPLIANGDLCSAEQIEAMADVLRPACGIMIGRMAVARPWLFGTWGANPQVDYAGVWRRMYQYILEDFEPPVALRRIQMFTKYYAANFAFGHSFYHRLARARSPLELLLLAEDFFSRSPATVSQPVVAGL